MAPKQESLKKAYASHSSRNAVSAEGTDPYYYNSSSKNNRYPQITLLRSVSVQPLPLRSSKCHAMVFLVQTHLLNLNNQITPYKAAEMEPLYRVIV